MGVTVSCFFSFLILFLLISFFLAAFSGSLSPPLSTVPPILSLCRLIAQWYVKDFCEFPYPAVRKRSSQQDLATWSSLGTLYALPTLLSHSPLRLLLLSLSPSHSNTISLICPLSARFPAEALSKSGSFELNHSRYTISVTAIQNPWIYAFKRKSPFFSQQLQKTMLTPLKDFLLWDYVFPPWFPRKYLQIRAIKLEQSSSTKSKAIWQDQTVASSLLLPQLMMKRLSAPEVFSFQLKSVALKRDCPLSLLIKL